MYRAGRAWVIYYSYTFKAQELLQCGSSVQFGKWQGLTRQWQVSYTSCLPRGLWFKTGLQRQRWSIFTVKIHLHSKMGFSCYFTWMLNLHRMMYEFDTSTFFSHLSAEGRKVSPCSPDFLKNSIYGQEFARSQWVCDVRLTNRGPIRNLQLTSQCTQVWCVMWDVCVIPGRVFLCVLKHVWRGSNFITVSKCFY